LYVETPNGSFVEHIGWI